MKRQKSIPRRLFFFTLFVCLPFSAFSSGEPDSSDFDLDTTGAAWSGPIQISGNRSRFTPNNFCFTFTHDKKLLVSMQGPSNTYRYLILTDRYGNVEMNERWGYGPSDNFLWDNSGQLWLVGRNRGTLGVNRALVNGELMIGNEVQTPLNVHLNGAFRVKAFNCNDGDISLWYMATNDNIQTEIRWSKLTNDFETITEEGVITGSQRAFSMAITQGPGDTLHMAYAFDNISPGPLYYLKCSPEGDIYYGPDTRDDPDLSWQNSLAGTGGIAVDDIGNAYILSQRTIPPSGEYDIQLRLYGPNGTYSSRIISSRVFFQETLCCLTIDCIGRIHIFQKVQENHQYYMDHGIITSNELNWEEEPHHIVQNTIYNPEAVSFPGEYRIGFAFRGYPGQGLYSELLYYVLGRTEDEGAQPDIMEYVSVSKNKLESTSIYPNPFNESCFITLRNISSNNIVIDVYDIVGRRIGGIPYINNLRDNMIFTFPNDFINSNVSSSGTYFLSIKTDRMILIRKLVIQK